MVVVVSLVRLFAGYEITGSINASDVIQGVGTWFRIVLNMPSPKKLWKSPKATFHLPRQKTFSEYS